MSRLTLATAVVLVVVVTGVRGAPSPQPGPSMRQLAGTWTLVSIERPDAGGRLTSLPFPRGLLVLDSAGHIFEGVQHGRPQGAPALGERQLAFATFSGFWGTYTVDGTTPTQSITIKTRGAVHPNLQTAEFGRAVTIAADPTKLSPTSHPAKLTMTAGTGEPYAGTRWTWERVPPVENLSPAFRDVSGFWEHVIEKRVNLATGTSTDTTRAPSVIVYTPSGYVGVHFPPRNRAMLVNDEPTEAEARAALNGYVGYFGALTVYPGQVFHHPLASIGLIANGNTIKRFYETSGDVVTVTFPATGSGQQQNTTVVTLKRLSGIDQMMPR
ncbi:MAG: lipocalin-like domain-containing protein [Vicinamibacterales bacterium]